MAFAFWNGLVAWFKRLRNERPVARGEDSQAAHSVSPCAAAFTGSAEELRKRGYAERERMYPEAAPELFLGSLNAAQTAHDRQAEARALLALADNALHFVPVHEDNVFDRRERLARQSLAIFREHGDDRGVVDACQLLSLELPHSEGLAMLEESIALAERIGYVSGMSRGLLRLGQIQCLGGDRQQGIDAQQQALDVARSSGEMRLVARVLVSPGVHIEGKDAQHRSLFEEAHALCRELGLKGSLARDLQIAAMLACGETDIDIEEGYLNESLILCREIGDFAGETTCLSLLAAVARRRGDEERAQALEPKEKWHPDFDFSEAERILSTDDADAKHKWLKETIG